MAVKAFTALSRSTSKLSANTATNRDRVIVVSFVLVAVVVVVTISCLLGRLSLDSHPRGGIRVGVVDADVVFLKGIRQPRQLAFLDPWCQGRKKKSETGKSCPTGAMKPDQIALCRGGLNPPKKDESKAAVAEVLTPIYAATGSTLTTGTHNTTVTEGKTKRTSGTAATVTAIAGIHNGRRTDSRIQYQQQQQDGSIHYYYHKHYRRVVE